MTATSIAPFSSPQPNSAPGWRNTIKRRASCGLATTRRDRTAEHHLAESVDEALCFGWIDGLRKSIDDASYMIRFTPRKPDSTWSAVNIGRVAELTEQGRMQPAGLAAFARRREEKSAIYNYEQTQEAALAPAEEQQFIANPAGWQFFQSQPPSYRQAAIRWVIGAKKPRRRPSRLARLIEDSAQGRTVPPLTCPTKAQ